MSELDDDLTKIVSETYKRLNRGTGSKSFKDNVKIIEYPFDRFDISVEVGPNNEFLGIVAVKINKDFLSYAQKLRNATVHDMGEFYKDE